MYRRVKNFFLAIRTFLYGRYYEEPVVVIRYISKRKLKGRIKRV